MKEVRKQRKEAAKGDKRSKRKRQPRNQEICRKEVEVFMAEHLTVPDYTS